ncbi:hypothetical protein QBC41DRAFT_106999 [Cercophora samala]|uniref:Secreted protein n=1 Tax=Cercophora samala TaxID=330535 RepID=A0AA39ZFF5_9PEZI|nr:hypothetical protein QBC41DRAFT_106999 [Cercophora samala]
MFFLFFSFSFSCHVSCIAVTSFLRYTIVCLDGSACFCFCWSVPGFLCFASYHLTNTLFFLLHIRLPKAGDRFFFLMGRKGGREGWFVVFRRRLHTYTFLGRDAHLCGF